MNSHPANMHWGLCGSGQPTQPTNQLVRVAEVDKFASLGKSALGPMRAQPTHVVDYRPICTWAYAGPANPCGRLSKNLHLGPCGSGQPMWSTIGPRIFSITWAYAGPANPRGRLSANLHLGLRGPGQPMRSTICPRIFIRANTRHAGPRAHHLGSR